jgi:hypothetical protein
MPMVQGIEILGRHPEADGIEFRGTMQPTLSKLLIREVRNGVTLSERNRNLLVDSCHIYNCSGVGILFSSVNLHQAIINASHISYCKRGGIKVVDGEIRNLQITGNDIEYNYDPEAKESADICFDVTNGTIAEGTITGNTIQAKVSPGGANIRFVGAKESTHPTPMSMWTITGNLVGSQEVNIHLVRCRGMTISANHIYSGKERSLILENCQNMVVGANSLDQSHNRGQGFANGVSIRDSNNVIVNAVVLDDCAAGNAQSGGAFEIINSHMVTISHCHIVNPLVRAVWISRSTWVQVVSNQLRGSGGEEGAFTAAIQIHRCPGTVVVKDNIIASGNRPSIIVDDDSQAIIDGNVRPPVSGPVAAD